MELLIIMGISAVILIVATIVRDLFSGARDRRTGADSESERSRRDIQRGKTLGHSHFVGLDNLGHRR